MATRPMPSLAFIISLHSLFHTLIAATPNPSASTSYHTQTTGHLHHSPPTDGFLYPFRRQYGWTLNGQLTSWSMVQSMTLCGLVGLLTVWWRRNATAGQSADPPQVDATDAQRGNKQADAASTRSKPSLTGRCSRLPTPALIITLRFLSFNAKRFLRCSDHRPWIAEKTLDPTIVYYILCHLSRYPCLQPGTSPGRQASLQAYTSSAFGLHTWTWGIAGTVPISVD